MANCEICGKELTGRKQKFCSPSCKNKTTKTKELFISDHRERAIQRKTKLVEIMGGQCCKCGYNKNYAALCFHHIDPKFKLFNLNSRSLSSKSWNKILIEAEKCILLCSNCHQELHNPSYIPSFNTVNLCQSCGVQLKSFGKPTCSKCQAKKREKINWPTTKELLELLKINSYHIVEQMLGVSESSIRKRIKNHPY